MSIIQKVQDAREKREQEIKTQNNTRWLQNQSSSTTPDSNLYLSDVLDLASIAGEGLVMTNDVLAVNESEVDHNSLDNLQGGATDEFYHLSAALYGYLDVSSSIQAQLDAKLALAGGTITGNTTLANGVYLLFDGGATGQTAGIYTAADLSRLRVRAEGTDRVAEFASYGLYCPRAVDTNIYATGGIIVDYGDTQTAARGLKFGSAGTAQMWFDGTDLNINEALKVDILKSILYDVSLRIKNNDWLYVVDGTDSGYKGVAALNYYGSSTVHSTATTTKILVDDSHYYKYRTAAEVATDLGVDDKLALAGGTITGDLAVNGDLTVDVIKSTNYDLSIVAMNNNGWLYIRNKLNSAYEGVAAKKYYGYATPHLSTAATSYLVSDNGYYSYRTASEVATDLGATTASDINDPYAVGTSGDYYWQQFFSDMRGFSDSIYVGDSIHLQRTYFYLEGYKSGQDGKIYYFSFPLSVPKGWKIVAVDLLSYANQYTNLNWSNLTLFARYLDSSFSTFTYDSILNVTNPFGTGTGQLPYHSGETATPHAYTNFKDATAYNLTEISAHLTVHNAAISSHLDLYTLALNVKFEKI